MADIGMSISSMQKNEEGVEAVHAFPCPYGKSKKSKRRRILS